MTDVHVQPCRSPAHIPANMYGEHTRVSFTASVRRRPQHVALLMHSDEPNAITRRAWSLDCKRHAHCPKQLFDHDCSALVASIGKQTAELNSAKRGDAAVDALRQGAMPVKECTFELSPLFCHNRAYVQWMEVRRFDSLWLMTTETWYVVQRVRCTASCRLALTAAFVGNGYLDNIRPGGVRATSSLMGRRSVCPSQGTRCGCTLIMH
jgi:hypothetical protein